MNPLTVNEFGPWLERSSSADRKAWARDFVGNLDAAAFRRDRDAAVLDRLDRVGGGWGHLLVWSTSPWAAQTQAAVLRQPFSTWESHWVEAIRDTAARLCFTGGPDPVGDLLQVWPEAYPELALRMPDLVDDLSSAGRWPSMDLILGASCRRGFVDTAQSWIEALGRSRFPLAAYERDATLARQRAEAAGDGPLCQATARPRVRS